MRGKLLLIVSAVAAFHVSAANSFFEKGEPAAAPMSQRITSPEELCQRLAADGAYAASASYGVLLPSADDEIVYDINLQSAVPGDTIAPCRYLISWEVATPSGKSDGFSSYTDGDHFRYSDERLQEYHFDNDPAPFMSPRGGVQDNARFANLLPPYLAEEIARVTTDSAFTYTFNPDAVYGGNPVVRIDASETVKGYTARELSYIFDAVSGMPLRITIESNPGAVSEQSVTIDYSAPDFIPVDDFSENSLIALYPEVFEKFRSGNFKLENLPGTMMPQFSLPTLGGDRVTHHRGEAFTSPTVIAVIDPEVATAAATVDDIRRGVNALPAAVDIIWAVKSRHHDTVRQLIGNSPREGEKTLLGASSIIRDCGITAFPAMIFVGTDGTIKSVHIGANKNLSEIVMQKAALL